MRKPTIPAAALAAVLALLAPVKNAGAMPAATPSQLGLAGGGADVLEKTVLVCDPWACYWRPGYWGYYRPYSYWGWRRHYWWGWHRPWWG